MKNATAVMNSKKINHHSFVLAIIAGGGLSMGIWGASAAKATEYDQHAGVVQRQRRGGTPSRADPLGQHALRDDGIRRSLRRRHGLLSPGHGRHADRPGVVQRQQRAKSVR